MWQDGTFVPCTVHAKKRALPEFEGYTRKEEDRLRDFALEELYHLLHYKKQARYFSEDMQLMADPEYDPPTPSPNERKAKKAKEAPGARQGAAAHSCCNGFSSAPSRRRRGGRAGAALVAIPSVVEIAKA